MCELNLVNKKLSFDEKFNRKGALEHNITVVKYEINFSRVLDRRLKLGISDGKVFADDEEIFVAKGLKVGLFEN